MNTSAALNELLMVSKTKYDHQQQAFAQILAEEARLRNELIRIDEMGTEMAQEDANLIPMRAVGADMLWFSWLSRSKANLNMQLARVLAAKGREQENVRRAFGKMIALQDIIKQGEEAKQRQVKQRALADAIGFSLRGC